MQAIYKNEVERLISRGTNPMNIIICSRWISGYLERECCGGIGSRRDRI